MSSERRSGADRRKKFTITTLFHNGTRRDIRRREDHHKIFFVDQYSSTIFAAIVLILFLSVLDAVMTAVLLDHGAHEMNPFLAYILEVEPTIFLFVKYLLTATCMFILLVFRNVFIKRVKIYTRTLFPVILSIFACVIIWELFLIYHVVGK